MTIGRVVRGGLLAAVAVVAVLAVHQLVTWPDVARLATEPPSTTAFIERYRERELAAGKKVAPAWKVVPYARIADDLKVAVLVAEDIDFFSHHGFAIEELKKAIAEAWEEGEAPRGASTLTQQLAKNLWLSPSRNPWRKVKEALLTRELERKLAKRRILELYLNVVEFGPGIYGAEAASRHYFGRSAATLTADESAALAGSLPKPSKWHPGANSKVYRSRVERIRRRMEKASWLRREI